MASKYSAILKGYVDFYCLVCETHFRSEADVENHVVEDTHTKNLDANCFVEKYKEDCIRKVKKGYFCEFCNILFSTAAKLGLHVSEESHMNNKGSQLLKRVFNSDLGVLAFDNTMIDRQAWHGLIDNTCVICNMEFYDEKEHRHETSHILNLVQSKVLFVDKNIYRKIDDSSFHCLTCNTVLALSSITAHFDNSQHKKLYYLCEYDVEIAAQARAIFMKDEIISEVKKTEVEVRKPDVLEIPQEKPVPKKQESKPTPTEAPKMIELSTSVKKERVILRKATHDMDKEIIKALDAKDYITTCEETGQKWCLLCDWTMDTMMILNHVNGKHHNITLNMHKNRLKQKSLEAKLIEDAQIPDVIEDISKDNENETDIDEIITKFQDYVKIEGGNAVCMKCSLTLNLDVKYIDAHIDEHKKALTKKETASLNSKQTAKSGNVQKTASKIEKAASSVAKAEKETRASSVAKTEKETRASSVAKAEKDSRSSSVAKTGKESRASSVASNIEDEDIEKFAKDNNLAFNRRDSKAYCQVCDSLIPSSLKNMKEHIAGISHKNKVVKTQQHSTAKDVILKKPMVEFLTTTRAIENGIMRDIIVNEMFCLNVLSFMTITVLDGERSKCEGCEVILDRLDQLEEHTTSLCHQKVMCTMPITLSTDEFLREIRPDTTHCGFCNEVINNEELESHLATTQHNEGKTFSFWRLLQYQQLSDVVSETRKDVDMQMFVKLLSEELF